MSIVSAGNQTPAPHLRPQRTQTRQGPIVDCNKTIPFHVLLQEYSPGKTPAFAAQFLVCGIFGRNPSTSDLHPICPTDHLTVHLAERLHADHGNSHADIELWIERDLSNDFDQRSAGQWRAFEEAPGRQCTSTKQTSGKSRNLGAPEVVQKKLHQGDGDSADQVVDVCLQPGDRFDVADSHAGLSRGGLRSAAQRTLLQPASGSNSPVLVAVHALDAGLRVYVRIGATELQGLGNLEDAVRATLAGHGLSSAEVVIDTAGVAQGNPREERA